MIRKIKYQDIDFDKYNQCIEHSQQRKYSATQLFLDSTSHEKWEVLVYGDYEAVMPIPYIKKGFLKIVVNPKLCQQLGVFSRVDSQEINDLFYAFLIKNYNVWYYAFNEENKLSANLMKRQNFILEVEDYTTVYQRYSPKRKRKLRLDEEVKQNSEVRYITFQEAQNFIGANFIGAKDEGDKQEFLEIFRKLEQKKALQIIGFFLDEKLINALALYKDAKTVALLGTFNDKEYIKIAGSCVLIDEVIKENISQKIFDFEGSEVPSVEEFFRGFRPQQKHYSAINRPKKDVLKSWYKSF